MSERPDFDVGDLVVCVDDRPCGVHHVRSPARVLRRVYTVAAIKHGTDKHTGYTAWGCKVQEVPTTTWENCICYRKIEPKPPEFWTGEVEVDQRDKVPA